MEKLAAGPGLFRKILFVTMCALLGSVAGARSGVSVSFEDGVPVVSPSAPGFRAQDAQVLIASPPGAAGTGRSGHAILAPGSDTFFFQGPVRRFYLVSESPSYLAGEFNCLTLFVYVPEGSSLVSERPAARLGVWTYHWKPGDPKVGGTDNQGLMTDSMMHGYSNFSFRPGCEDRWLELVLSPSAFQQQRNYFHWYAARGVTGEYDFFGTLRQLQFKYLGPWEAPVTFRIDEIGFRKRSETARLEPSFVEREVSVRRGEVVVPIRLENPTGRDRRYRFFLSSEIGASRESLYQPMWTHNELAPAREVQQAVGGDGGLGVAVLQDAAGEICPPGRSISVAAGGTWHGRVVHRISPEMLGPWAEVRGFTVRRDTLTTSAVFWDPEEPPAGDMEWVQGAPSNADDGTHPPPPGFPKQVRPPDGWRSGDIPLSQVGGYFVSEITLRP